MRCMKRRRKLAVRIALWFAAVVGSVLLLQLPRVVHEWRMKGQVEQMLAAMHEELGPSPPMQDVVTYLKKQSFQVWMHDFSYQLHASRGLSGGSPFWEPVSARIQLRFDADSRLRESEVDLWPHAGSGLRRSPTDAIVPKFSGLIWVVVLLWVIIKRERRALRWNRDECPQCGYPVGGDGDACPECGASLADSRPRVLRGSANAS